MAMIRGRTIKSSSVNVENEITTVDSKETPLARLKQQRRLTIGYSKTPEKLLTAIDDPDPFYRNKNTFLVLNKNRQIHRFSEEKSLFLLGRNSKIRMAFINILINKWFNGLVITTILVNCLIMIINGNDKHPWSEHYVEHFFTAIYTGEAFVKIVGRGFVLHRFSYLRDAWNWLDFIVILAAYVLIILPLVTSGGSSTLSSLTFLRAIRVLRVFKTVSVIPGLRMIVSALVASTKALKDAMLLSLLGFSMFSLVGIQLFRGTLQHKCVVLPPWMLTYEEDCPRNSTNLLCSFHDAAEIILEKFGPVTLHEIKYLHMLLANQNSSSSTRDTNATSMPSVFPHNDFWHLEKSTSGSDVEVGGPRWDDVTDIHSTCSNLTSTDWTFAIRQNDTSFNESEHRFDWNRWINEERHYLKGDMSNFMLCGNASSALQCPDYASCIRVGQNPNFGFTSFDNFPFAFLSVFRLSLQDNWEELYQQTLETNGQLAWFFFFAMIFLGSYYLVNLILAVVASSYEDQRRSVANSLEEEKCELLKEREILKKRRNAASSSISRDSITLLSTQTMLVGNKCLNCSRFKEIFLLWSCCIGNSILCRIRGKLKDFFMHSTAEMITVAMVVLNTLVLALEKEPKDERFHDFLKKSNIVFTLLFAVEMALKMFALSPYNYFKATWNIFDFVVVTLSLFEVIISDKLPDGLSVLRTFRLIRLVRILKLAKSWPTLSKLMQMIADSLSKVGYLTLVLLIVLVIFALAGMQTVGNQFHYDRGKGIPLRWHMNDFSHSFLVVFRIQCGEWIQNMWSCMNSVREEDSPGLMSVCVFIFIGVVFVGNLVVLNLFLALLLNSFSSDALNNGGGKNGSARKILKSLRSAGKKAIPKISNAVSRKRKVGPYSDSGDGQLPQLGQADKKNYSFAEGNRDEEIDKDQDSNDKSLKSTRHLPIARPRCSTYASPCKDASETRLSVVVEETESQLQRDLDESENENKSNKTNDAIPHDTNGCNNNSVASKNNEVDFPRNIFPIPIKQDNLKWMTSVGRISYKNHWKEFRKTMNKIVNHDVFETFIIFVIMLSSIALVFEDVHLHKKKQLQMILGVSDRIFSAIFVIEMIMKWIGLGLKKYFTNGWCLLDFAIVVVSVVSLSLEIAASSSGASSADLSSLRVLRSLRAFRPLRAMSRFHGIKVVTDALFRSIPSILNVFVICLIFWLIFAIMGVNLFAGKMASCRWVETGEKVWHPQDFATYPNLSLHYQRPPIDVLNRTDCECLATLTGGKVHWRNLYVNFDNVLIAYVALLQVATFKGWMPIMYAAVDAPQEVGQQPIHDNQVVMYYFFVAFIIFGAFFTLNLFISVVIDNFNQQKKKFELAGAELFLSDSQRKAYSAMKKLKTKLPRKLFPIPKSRWRERLYLLVTGDKFELTVMVVTILNLVAMTVEFEGMSRRQQMGLIFVNYVFIGLFTIEILLRLVAMGYSYFFIPWNVFDFVVIFVSLMVNIIPVLITNDDGGDGLPVSSSPWLPMLRMIRVVRVLRVARVASGIRTLLFALMLSAPALINVGSLLMLFMFIYAIFGMSQFSHVEKRGAINDILNFETFPNTFLLLFQMSTSAGWDGFMEPTLYVDSSVDPCSSGLNNDKKTCKGSSFTGYFYFISYLLLTFVIVTNMYIAIILENFDIATKDNEEALTADDFEHLFDLWQRYDKNADGKLSVDELSDLLHVIDEPLRIRKPNKSYIANMRIPMCEGDELHIVDVAAALIKKTLGSEGFSEEMEEELNAYYKRHASKAVTLDNGVRIGDTYQYAEALKEREAKEGRLRRGTLGNLSLRVRKTLMFEEMLRPTSSRENMNLRPTTEESYQAVAQLDTDEAGVVLCCSRASSKTAKIVQSPPVSETSSPMRSIRNKDEVVFANELRVLPGKLSRNQNQSSNINRTWQKKLKRVTGRTMSAMPLAHSDSHVDVKRDQNRTRQDDFIYTKNEMFKELSFIISPTLSNS